MVSLLVLFFLLSITFSFLCSLWESVLLSITPAYAQIKMQSGSRIGKELNAFKQEIDRPLIAILTLNTVAHTVGAIGVGEQAYRIWHDTNPMITGVLVPVVMTLAILILSEIIPKTLGATYWQKFVPFTVVSLRIILIVLHPVVVVSQFLTGFLKSDRSESVMSRSDFLHMAKIGEQEGVFEKNESLLISSLLKFNSVCAKDVMTPRTVIRAASTNLSLREFYDTAANLQFSRVPLFENDSKDHIVGYVLKDEVLAKLVDGKDDAVLKSLMREIAAVDENFPIPELFNHFIQSREHIALVVDGFGGTSGIVTMEDVIETLLGMEIMDEVDKTRDMQVLARHYWEKRAKSLGLITEPSESNASE